jgi:hypothetical protein
MLFLEHGAERTDLPGAETHVPGLQRTTQLEREVAVALGDVGASSGRCGERAHDVAWNPDDLAVEADLDRLLSHIAVYGPELDPLKLFRGLNA